MSKHEINQTLDWTKMAVSGATGGAVLGSFLGIVGSIIGASIGGVIGGIGGYMIYRSPEKNNGKNGQFINHQES